MLGDEILQSWEVRGDRIDITDQESGAMSSEKMVAGNSLDYGIGGSYFVGVTMRAAMPIDTVPVAKTPSFAFAMGNQLGPPQFNEGGKALTARFQWQACVRGKGNHTNTSTGLCAIGIRPSEVELSSMLGAEAAGKATHSGPRGTVFLKERHISMPGGQTFSMRFKVGDILSLNNGDAWWCR